MKFIYDSFQRFLQLFYCIYYIKIINKYNIKKNNLLWNTESMFRIKVFMMVIWTILITMGIWKQNPIKRNILSFAIFETKSFLKIVAFIGYSIKLLCRHVEKEFSNTIIKPLVMIFKHLFLIDILICTCVWHLPSLPAVTKIYQTCQ